MTIFKYFFYTVVFILSLGQLSVIETVGEVKVYLFDIVMALYVYFGFIYLFGVKKKMRLPKSFVPFLLFVLIMIISGVANLHKYESSQFVVIGFYGVRFLLYVFGALITSNIVDNQDILKAFVFSGLFVVLVGFLQLLVLPDFGVLDPLSGWDSHKNRLASTFFDPNFVGSYLVLCFVIAFFNNKNKYFLIKLILLIGIVLTFSRSAWGMLAVVVLIFGLIRNGKILLVAGILSFSAYFAVPRIQTRLVGITDPSDSASLRLVSWKNGWEIAKDNLLLGVGFNAIKYVQQEYGYLTPDTVTNHNASGADSSLLVVLITTGISGLFMFLFGMLWPIVRRKNLFLALIIIPLILESQFINSLFYPQIMFLWLSMLDV